MKIFILRRVFFFRNANFFHSTTILKSDIKFSSQFRRPDSKLATMKLEIPLFKAVLTAEVNYLSEIFQRHNYELRMAGGAVRDLLNNKQPDDIDFATTATPDEMRNMFQHEGKYEFSDI